MCDPRRYLVYQVENGELWWRWDVVAHRLRRAELRPPIIRYGLECFVCRGIDIIEGEDVIVEKAKVALLGSGK